MALLESAHPTETTAEPETATRPWLSPLLGGAAAAACGLVLCLMAAGIVGALAARATTDWGNFFGVGASLWLVMGGGRLAADGVFLALTPLAGFGLLLWAAIRGARSTLPESGPTRIPYAAYLGGYAAVAAAGCGVALAGPATPVWWSLPLPVLGIPALALALAEGRRGRLDKLTRHIPRTVRRAVGPAWRTSLVLLALGMLGVLAAVALHLGSVGTLYRELDTGLLGALALTVGQLAALPNLGLWVLSALTGPGFAVTEGARVSLGSADTGVLPMIPVFGALPGGGDFGWYVRLLWLLPVFVGGYAARRTLAGIPRLASGRTKLGSVAVTVLLTSVFLGILDAIAGGSLGDGRLASVGPSALSLSLSLLVSLGIGAGVVVARDWWRLRR